MDNPPTHQVTRLLLAWSDGDEAAPDQLMPLVYEELRQLARGYLRQENSDHTLQPTALVHEAYLRLVDATQITWQSRAHFYGIAARLMRRILVDHARRQAASKRGGGVRDIPLEDAGELAQEEAPSTSSRSTARWKASRTDYPRQRDVVELKFFGGLEAREIGEALQISERTVVRDWEFARFWLRRELNRRARRPS